MFLFIYYMKYHWIILLFALLFCPYISAQSPDIIKDLNTDKTGQGTVRIYQDESLEGLLGSKRTPGSTANTNELMGASGLNDTTTDAQPTHYIQAKGYKIQIFSGNDQKKSKDVAYSRKSLIQGSYPNLEVTITFNSPVWRARAGNFKTYEQASQALTELKATFPSFGKEMQIVESAIKLPVY